MLVADVLLQGVGQFGLGPAAVGLGVIGGLLHLVVLVRLGDARFRLEFGRLTFLPGVGAADGGIAGGFGLADGGISLDLGDPFLA